VTNAKTVEVRDHLLYALNQVDHKVEPSKLSTTQKKQAISDKLNTFNYAFEATAGEGSVTLIRAAKHARDLGMTNQEIIDLMYEINTYWVSPMPEERFKNTIISQIGRW
jgi:hypothetical protein